MTGRQRRVRRRMRWKWMKRRGKENKWKEAKEEKMSKRKWRRTRIIEIKRKVTRKNEDEQVGVWK
jgi:hypothetical protein